MKSNDQKPVEECFPETRYLYAYLEIIKLSWKEKEKHRQAFSVI